MKLIISLISLSFLSSTIGQTVSEKARHVQIIDATTYNGKDTIDHRITKVYYDSLWKVLDNSNTLSGALENKSHAVTIINTPTKFSSAEVTNAGDTLSYLVYLFDSNGNKTNYFVIRDGDTVNDQKRVYDDLGNNIELYNKKDGEYYLRMKTTYDVNNKVASQQTFNNRGDLVKFEKYERQNDGQKTKYFEYDRSKRWVLKSLTEDIGSNTTKTSYFHDVEGINYGITLKYTNGGYSIVEKSGIGNLVRIEIYDKQDSLTTSVYFRYVDL